MRNRKKNSVFAIFDLKFAKNAGFSWDFCDLYIKINAKNAKIGFAII